MSARLLKFTSEVSMITEVCCNCGVAFAMPSDMQERRKKDRQAFFCPAGHSQSYLQEPETETLKKKIAQLEADKQTILKRKEWAEQAAKQATAEAEKAKRSLKTARERSKAGVCPCCKRTVKQMAAHMAEKHPDFKP